MEAPRPMDRLICGDVGYGKTEVALRAAFKAVQDGKQVMLLVPTTILAQQHYGTFTERLKDFPITIEHASRFRPQRRATRSGEAVRRGKGRHPHRDPPAPVQRRPPQGARPADRRRGAAVRRQAEGAAPPAQAQGRRDLDERHADPAHAPDVDGRDPRHQRDRDAARGSAADQDLRRRVRRGAGQDRPAPRAPAQGPGVLPAQPDRVDRRDRRAAARAVPGDEVRGRPRADGRKGARAAHARVPQRRRGRARVHEHHRVGDRHPAGEHADRRAGGHVRPRAAVPDPRPRGTRRESGRTPTSCIRAPPR